MWVGVGACVRVCRVQTWWTIWHDCAWRGLYKRWLRCTNSVQSFNSTLMSWPRWPRCQATQFQPQGSAKWHSCKVSFWIYRCRIMMDHVYAVWICVQYQYPVWSRVSLTRLVTEAYQPIAIETMCHSACVSGTCCQWQCASYYWIWQTKAG